MRADVLLAALCASLAVNVALLVSSDVFADWATRLSPAAWTFMTPEKFMPEGPGRKFLNKVVKRKLLLDEEALANATARKPDYDAAHLSAEDVRDIGSVFFYERFAELVAQDDAREALGEPMPMDRPVGKPALDYIGVQLSDEELAEEKLRPETVEALVERIDAHGVFVLPSIIDPSLCRQLAEETNKVIHNPDDNFGFIAKPSFRKDHPLKLKGNVRTVMKKVLRMLEPVLQRTLGNNVRLRELSTLTTYPGAPSQDFHPDTISRKPNVKSVKLFSSFIYLDDIGMDQAPLDVFPGTHGHAHHLKPSHQRWLDQRAPFLRVAVPQGSLVMYDSRVRHRGSANNSPLVRPTVYFSVQEDVADVDSGSTYSIYSDYEELKVADVLSGRLPEIDLGPFPDRVCLENMKKKCPGKEHEELFKCSILPKGKPIREGDDNWMPRRTEDYKFPHRCFLVSRMEMLAQAHIFRPDFVTLASWGPLPNK
ncbi:Hypothetical Protein FCC1311_069992 [Hondaea fermentalgiana]|uniref:Uncharacterized protein n=1 Tax=Hondaea fermentalgiana TaxID=2315210 RepID=A0A2R5GKD4_9STRA|nr:Hypothetical Protein FCC1311_069992 [Hondaea fermentalgiana]|eukprot:GBG30779.1 Hypothetical Protein FCC1311_069992 [Hondaea fermentalgiana]